MKPPPPRSDAQPIHTRSGFAPNWNELAQRLGVSRKAIQLWRKDERYKDDYPKERADGRHDVAAWAEFMVRHGLKRADEFVSTPGNAGSQSTPGDNPKADNPVGIQFPPGCEADWKKALLAERVEREKTANAKEAGTLLVAAELEGPLGATLVAVTNKLTQFPERTAPLVTGFTDVLEIMEILRTEIEADLTILHAADYLADVDQLVGDLPTDAETARLLQLVTFAGQDQAALRQLIVHCVTAALRRIGSRAIAAAISPPIAHLVTGQVTDEADTAHQAFRAGSESSLREATTAASPPSSPTPVQENPSGQTPGKTSARRPRPATPGKSRKVARANGKRSKPPRKKR